MIVVDVLQNIFQLFLDFTTFQGSQASQAHIQNGFALFFREVELALQVDQGILRCLGLANGTDHSIQVIEGNFQALQDMLAGLSFSKFIASAARDHNLTMIDIML